MSAHRASEAGAIAAIIHARLDALENKTVAEAELTEAALSNRPGGSRFDKLLKLFNCDEYDRALLLTLLAAEFDPRVIPRFEALSGRPWVTQWLACLLFNCEGAPMFQGGGALSVWSLVVKKTVQVGEPPALIIDPAVKDWLSGHLHIPTRLQSVLALQDTPAPLLTWPVTEVAEKMAAAVSRSERLLLQVQGLQGAGRSTFAAHIAQHFKQRCYAVDPSRLGEPWAHQDTLLTHRYALVAGAALVWKGQPPKGALWPAGLWPVTLQAVALDDGETLSQSDPLAVFTVRLPVMQPEERRSLIESLVPASANWSENTLESICQRRALTPQAIQRLKRTSPATDADALNAANEHYATVMGDFAQLVHSELDWDDLVLPPNIKERLQDLSYESRVRAQTWRAAEVQRLFARESGMVALFQGTPGTGKTMAAQVIAKSLGLDLYRIDCSRVISKYIGETSKNLSTIFSRARSVDAVFLFDEAESLFAQRTEVRDAHDRHANTDTGQLLQLIEGEFEGVAILATNRMSDMDSAFLRRIRYTVEFPRPGAQERTEIWQRAAQSLIPTRADALSTLWPVLGEALDITGAQVKTTLLSAYFTAMRRDSQLDASDILKSVDREYSKEGRSIGTHEKERIRGYA